MTDQTTHQTLTDQQLDEIETRAAHLWEYVTVTDEAAQPDADQLTGEDVPALLAAVRRLRTENARYLGAWQSARFRAQAYGEGIERVVKDRESYQGWFKQAEARVAELEGPAVEARAALAALCYDLEDPGSNALGALYLLSQATVGVKAQPDDAAKVLAKRDGAVLRQAAEDLMAACPEHGDADEAWMDCPCEYAEELVRKAVLTEQDVTIGVTA